jgi:hypothetical protein
MGHGSSVGLCVADMSAMMIGKKMERNLNRLRSVMR